MAAIVWHLCRKKRSCGGHQRILHTYYAEDVGTNSTVTQLSGSMRRPGDECDGDCSTCLGGGVFRVLGLGFEGLGLGRF